MGLNLLSLATKFLGGAGASQQPATIQRTAEETKPASQLEQVNSAINPNPAVSNTINPQNNATVNRETGYSLAINPEVTNPQITAMKAETNTNSAPLAKEAGLEIKISQETINNLRPLFSALKELATKLAPELNLTSLMKSAQPLLNKSPEASNPVTA